MVSAMYQMENGGRAVSNVNQLINLHRSDMERSNGIPIEIFCLNLDRRTPDREIRI